MRYFKCEQNNELHCKTKKGANQNKHMLQVRVNPYLKYFWVASQGGEDLQRNLFSFPWVEDYCS